MRKLIKLLQKGYKKTTQQEAEPVKILNYDEMFGKFEHQDHFIDLLWKSLRGLNIGTGDEVLSSGEILILDYIKQELLKDKNHKYVIFDVGANQGQYALLISKAFEGTDFITYSFEPSKNTFQILSEKLKGNSNFKLINKGVSNESGILKLYTDANGSGMASLSKRDLSYRNIEMQKSEEVEITTLDEFCKSKDIGSIDFLKLDIEGYELHALKGANKILKKTKFIQFEFGGCNIDTRTFFKDFFMLLKDDFHIYRILQDGIIEIKEYHEIHEQFNTTNFLAIKKF